MGADQEAYETGGGRCAFVHGSDNESHLHARPLERGGDRQSNGAAGAIGIEFEGCVQRRVARQIMDRPAAGQERFRDPIRQLVDVDPVEMNLRPCDERH